MLRFSKTERNRQAKELGDTLKKVCRLANVLAPMEDNPAAYEAILHSV